MIRATLISLFTLLAAPVWAQVNVQEITSPGGVSAWLVEDHSIPFMSLDIRFRGGTSLDAPDKAGAVYLMTGLLEEGTGNLDAQGFATASESLAATFAFSPYRDSIAVTAQMLTQNRDAAVDLLHRALVEPAFTDGAIERVRAQVLSIIASNAQDPGQIAQARFMEEAFGADHPYGRPVEGTADTVMALTRQDVVDAHQGAMARDRVVVGASGDITPDELGALLDRLFAGLPATGAPMPEDASIGLDGGTTIVDYPTPQSVAIFGQPGIERDDPQFFAAFVLNQIIGGGNFNSRLMDQVRVQRGLTYGIYSYLALYDHGPLWLGQFSSSNDLVAEAVQVLRDQWADIAANGVTQEELDAAKLYLTGAYPLRFEGNANIAAILSGMQLDHMPRDYIATRNDNIQAVTLDDIRAVAARVLDPAALHVTVVGHPQGLAASN